MRRSRHPQWNTDRPKLTRGLRMDSMETSSLLKAAERASAVASMHTMEELYGLSVRVATAAEKDQSQSSSWDARASNGDSVHNMWRLRRGLRAIQLDKEGITE